MAALAPGAALSGALARRSPMPGAPRPRRRLRLMIPAAAPQRARPPAGYSLTAWQLLAFRAAIASDLVTVHLRALRAVAEARSSQRFREENLNAVVGFISHS
jgi:hypothetical protein